MDSKRQADWSEPETSGTPTPNYTAHSASLYSTIGIQGSTYEIGFRQAQEMLGEVGGRVYLDLGTGTGRSARFLKELGARMVVGVDHSSEMISVARRHSSSGIHYVRSREALPLKSDRFDGAFCASVLIEIRTKRALVRILEDTGRVLGAGAKLVVMSTNPDAFRHAYRSFSYNHAGALVSGAVYPCTIKSDTGQFTVWDTYWTEADYREAFDRAGFCVSSVQYPLPHPRTRWPTAEDRVPPFVLIRCEKAQLGDRGNDDACGGI